MITITARQSSLSTYEWCPHQYFLMTLGYPGTSNKAAERGTITHKVMELLAQVKKAQQEDKTSFEDDAFGYIDILECEPKLLTELSYKYYTKLHPELTWVKKDLKTCHDLVKQALEYKDGLFDPRNQHILDIELKFDIELMQDWAKYQFALSDGSVLEGQLHMKGTIDLIVQEKEAIHFIDYKTGLRKNWSTGDIKDFKKMEEDVQLRMYHYALAYLNPSLDTMLGSMYFIADGGPYTIPFSIDNLKDTEDFLKRKFNEIRQNNMPKRTIDWRCEKLCAYGPKGGEMIDKDGKPTGMTICDFIHGRLKRDGIDIVTGDYLDKSSLTKYSGGGRQ